MQEKTPSKRYSKMNPQFITPPLQKTLSEELKQVLNERNLLTVKSRKKSNYILFNMHIQKKLIV